LGTERLQEKTRTTKEDLGGRNQTRPQISCDMHLYAQFKYIF